MGDERTREFAHYAEPGAEANLRPQSDDRISEAGGRWYSRAGKRGVNLKIADAGSQSDKREGRNKRSIPHLENPPMDADAIGIFTPLVRQDEPSTFDVLLSKYCARALHLWNVVA